MNNSMNEVVIVEAIRTPIGAYKGSLKKLSAENKIVAPRIFAYTSFGQRGKNFNPLNDLPISTPEPFLTLAASRS